MLKLSEEKGSKVRIIGWSLAGCSAEARGKRKGRQNQKEEVYHKARWEGLYLRVFHNLKSGICKKPGDWAKSQVHFGHSTAPKAELISVFSTIEEEN